MSISEPGFLTEAERKVWRSRKNRVIQQANRLLKGDPHKARSESGLAMVTTMAKFRSAFAKTHTIVLQFYTTSRKQPVLIGLAASIIAFLLYMLTVFTQFWASIFSWPGALIINCASLWIFLQVLARSMVFPGSLSLFRNNTEYSFNLQYSAQLHYCTTALLRLICRISEDVDGQWHEEDSITEQDLEYSLRCLNEMDFYDRNFEVQRIHGAGWSAQHSTFATSARGRKIVTKLIIRYESRNFH